MKVVVEEAAVRGVVDWAHLWTTLSDTVRVVRASASEPMDMFETDELLDIVWGVIVAICGSDAARNDEKGRRSSSQCFVTSSVWSKLVRALRR